MNHIRIIYKRELSFTMKNQQKKSQSFETPILFIIFNRPKTTKEVFKQIRKIKPKQLFIAADGPRKHVPEDKEKCRKAREIVNKVDWDCEVKTLFRNKNLGGPVGIPKAIDWFFSYVEEGIILEDDCVPNQSFFKFCSELLEYYRNDTRVALISGNNFAENLELENNKSYFFSKYAFIWGWATWKSKWENFDFEMKGWPSFLKENQLITRFPRKHARLHWLEKLEQMYKMYKKYGNKKGQHWDRKLNMSIFMNSQLSVMPVFNLVSNIGYGEGSSNFKRRGPFQDLNTKELKFPLTHPLYIANNELIDDEHEKLRFSGNWKQRVIRKIGRFLPEKIKKIYRNYLNRT